MGVYSGELPSALTGYNYVFEREVAWGDMDAMGHVNNTRYLHFCESARIEFLRTQTAWNDNQVPNERIKVGLALAEVNCRYKAPVVYPDTLLIGLGIQKIGENSFEIQHLLYSNALERVAAQSTARLVNYNFSDLKRVALNEAQNEFLQSFIAPE